MHVLAIIKVANLAVEAAPVLVAGGAVQSLVAGGALEASLVPLEAPGKLLLRRVHRLQTHAAVVGHLVIFLNDHVESNFDEQKTTKEGINQFSVH